MIYFKQARVQRRRKAERRRRTAAEKSAAANAHLVSVIRRRLSPFSSMIREGKPLEEALADLREQLRKRLLQKDTPVQVLSHETDAEGTTRVEIRVDPPVPITVTITPPEEEP